jgi:hypothetical protein
MQPTADAARPVYEWLGDLITDIKGFVDAKGEPVSWSQVEDDTRQMVFESLDLADALKVLDAINDACQMSEVDKGKSEPGSKPGDPKAAQSTDASSAKKTLTKRRSASSRRGSRSDSSSTVTEAS